MENTENCLTCLAHHVIVASLRNGCCAARKILSINQSEQLCTIKTDDRIYRVKEAHNKTNRGRKNVSKKKGNGKYEDKKRTIEAIRKFCCIFIVRAMKIACIYSRAMNTFGICPKIVEFSSILCAFCYTLSLIL